MTRVAVRAGLTGLLALPVLLAGCALGPDDGPGLVARPESAALSATPAPSSPAPAATAPTRPLAGRVVVLDPGHQLGNRHHRAAIARGVEAGGGVRKACNTTGTATDAGYPEATFTWQVARLVRAELRRLGATVVLTRTANSDGRWGPCVDRRGEIGNPGSPGPDADLRVSIHGDGSRAPGAHGFHVVRPGVVPGWTDDIAADSADLARALRDALRSAGLATSTYRGTAGLDERRDLATLNHSDVPAVLVELGNMRDRRDAARMSSASGRRAYARALVAGVREWLAAHPD